MSNGTKRTEHGKAPWTYQYYTTTGTYIVEGPHGPVASIGERSNWPHRAERHAALIAAAPELLEEAENVLRRYGHLMEAHDAEYLQDAINKARGG